MRERKVSDIWGDMKSADVAETQAKRQASALCHVEHVHGNVINVSMTGSMSIGALLDEMGSKNGKERACGV